MNFFISYIDNRMWNSMIEKKYAEIAIVIPRVIVSLCWRAHNSALAANNITALSTRRPEKPGKQAVNFTELATLLITFIMSPADLYHFDDARMQWDCPQISTGDWFTVINRCSLHRSCKIHLINFRPLPDAIHYGMPRRYGTPRRYTVTPEIFLHRAELWEEAGIFRKVNFFCHNPNPITGYRSNTSGSYFAGQMFVK